MTRRIAIIGTLDTKGAEFAYLRGRIRELRDGDPGRGVASIRDVDEFIRDAFEADSADGTDVRWETEP